MARRLADAIAEIDGAEIAYPVEANGVFVTLPACGDRPPARRPPAALPFYVWDEDAGTIRLMCSWDTTEDDVDGLASAIAEAIGSRRPAGGRWATARQGEALATASLS